MEYKLNKIDMDVRQRVNDITKEGKVHSKKNDLKISKDANQKNGSGKEFDKKLLEKYNKKAKLIIKAVKADNIEIDGYLDQEEEKITTRGMFLDTRK